MPNGTEIKWIRSHDDDILCFNKDGIANIGTVFGLHGLRYLDEISTGSQSCLMISIQTTNENCFQVSGQGPCIPR